MAYPTVRKGSFVFMTIAIFFFLYGYILCVCSVSYIKAINTIGASFFYYSCFYAFYLELFVGPFCSLFIPWDRITMIFHGVDFLSVIVEPDGFSMLGIAFGSGFCRFIGLVCGLIFRVDFSTLHSSEECPGPCNKHVFFAPVGASLG